MSTQFKLIQEAVNFIKNQIDINVETGLILGSGLGDYADKFEQKTYILTKDIPNYPSSTVEGHSGKLVFGNVGKTSVLAIQGRTHAYEGYSLEEVTFCVRIMQALSVKKIIVTNAAGGINKNFKPGTLMLITDHINFTGNNALIGKNDEKLGLRFPDMSEPYSKQYIDLAEQTGIKLGFKLEKGVYVGVLGPSYETPAEIKMFQTIGGDAVGMSTVPDVIVANHCDMKVLGISCITNYGAGISNEKLSHADVTDVAKTVHDKFEQLLNSIIPKM